MNRLMRYIAGPVVAGVSLLGGCASDEKVTDFTPYGFEAGRPYSIRIVGGQVNGKRIDEKNPSIKVRPGERITGRITLEIDNPMHKNAVAPLVYFNSWDEPSRGFREVPRKDLSRLGVPSGKGTYEVEITDLVAPTNPGNYNIGVASAGVHFAGQIVSGTHAGTPVDWSKARPLTKLSPEQIKFASVNGWVVNDIYHKNAKTGEEDVRKGSFALDFLEVKVE